MESRTFSHLDDDISLYDYMLMQNDISLKSANPHIDTALLPDGLHKKQKIELIFSYRILFDHPPSFCKTPNKILRAPL